MITSQVTVTHHGPLALLLSTNDATAGTSIADPSNTLTDPIVYDTEQYGLDHIKWGRNGSISPNWIKVHPLGTGNADTTMLMSIFAVNRILFRNSSVKVFEWTYSLLGAWTCTLSAKTGVAGGVLGTSMRYADTLALTSKAGIEGVTVNTVEPESDHGAYVLVDGLGAEFVAVKFALNASASGCNALWKYL